MPTPEMLDEPVVAIEAVDPANAPPTQDRELLYQKFQGRIIHNPALDRTLVSFQANKSTPFYSWFKYKEGFSQQLVAYLLEQLWHHSPGVLLGSICRGRSSADISTP